MSQILASILMGSKSDWEGGSKMFDQFNIPHEARALSALGNKYPSYREAVGNYRTERAKAVLETAALR